MDHGRTDLATGDAVDLTIVPINVEGDGVNSANGIKVGADAFACVCVDDQNEALLYSAVQQLLGQVEKPRSVTRIHKTMIGNFRGRRDKTTPLQAMHGRERGSEGPMAMMYVTGKPLTPAAAAANAESARVPAKGERACFGSVLLERLPGDRSPSASRWCRSHAAIWDILHLIANLANKTLSRKRRDVRWRKRGWRPG